MIRKWLGISVLILTGFVVLNSASCGRNQQLASITVQPTTETFGASNIPVSMDAGLQVQLRALGNYIHPPVTKDITNQVTWASNDTQMMTVTSTGMLTATGITCGTSLVSATVTTNKSTGDISSNGALITGYMTGNVVCDTGTGTGGSGPSITVNFLGTGTGTISSTPGGLSCASSSGSCISAAFASGSTVMITAAPAGTFGGWLGCNAVDGTGLICTVSNLTTAVTLTATFN